MIFEWPDRHSLLPALRVRPACAVRAEGVSMAELARRFGVHRTTIWHKLRDS
ncbi:MAG TPA: helix-turn-helix domain-containing protein [Streptosporangiaceae bacterium]